ncbi:MAG: UDP-glucose/GDP-mannose dehydrogenase family protein [Alphaproteobacteria bacterium]|nr:UDP-glucose/GDP-mannose dehydrogenase family protein [Alphaproteobacteria bacterium]
MKIGIVGTGYVGLPSGVGFAELGNDVICVDNNPEKIAALQEGKLTIFEDGLHEMFVKNVKSGRLKFTTSMKEGVENADIVIIAVGTPPHPETKEADMQYIYAAAKEMAQYLRGYTVIANKSTVPVGTGDEVEKIIREQNPNADFDVVSLPEFLREGFAIYDFFNPDRIVIGANSERAKALLQNLYAPFNGKTQILNVKRRSSETIKYASNAFLAMKIHYINEMANFCEKAGADIYEVAKGMGTDSRIGKRFLNPGPGYGGSCFPKDTNAMAFMARKFGVNLNLIETAIKGNDERKIEMADRVLEVAKKYSQAKVAVLGLAFKNGTDDCRESPAMQIVCELLKHDVSLRVYDPKAMENACKLVGDKLEYANDEYDAAKGADVLVILTEWGQFADLDLLRIRGAMRHYNIIDLRNMLKSDDARNAGFNYQCIGL